MNNIVYIRVDGNEIIATGHVMRCLSIAEQLRKQDVEVIFLISDDKSETMIKEKKFQVNILNTIWNNLDEEIPVITNYIKENDVKVLLMDSYCITERYLHEISKYTKVVYIDDLKLFPYDVYALIHDNPFSTQDKYRSLYSGYKLPELLVGGRYAPLREEFMYKPYYVNEEVKRILITTGGTDSLNISGRLLERLIKEKTMLGIEFHVIVGRFNIHREELKDMASLHDNIYLHENVTNMSYWMRNCDIAVSAGGTTLYELCACGIPTICLSIAENQEETGRWQDKGYMRYAGNACKNMDECINNCVINIKVYCENVKIREKLSKRMQSLLDGLGAKRIAEYLKCLVKTSGND